MMGISLAGTARSVIPGGRRTLGYLAVVRGHEIMLPDGHAGVRDADGRVHHPTGSVSRYRLVESAEGGDYHYKVVPQDG